MKYLMLTHNCEYGHNATGGNTVIISLVAIQSLRQWWKHNHDVIAGHTVVTSLLIIQL